MRQFFIITITLFMSLSASASVNRNFQVFSIPPAQTSRTERPAQVSAPTYTTNTEDSENSEVTTASLGETTTTTVATPDTSGPSIFARDSDPEKIKKEMRNLRAYLAAHPDEAEPYAFINVADTNGALNTFFVEVSTGKIIKNFPSLLGYNGVGCGSGQTRPGIYKISGTIGKGASRFPWWGNNYAAMDIQDVKQGSTCGKPLNSEVMAHSNINVPDTRTSRITSRSAGCFTTSPNNLDLVMKYAGRALIYNAVGASDTNPARNSRAQVASLWW